MTSTLDTSESSRGDRARSHAYLRDFIPAMVGYVVVLAAVSQWGGLQGTSPWRYVWALLPVLPVLLVVRAVTRALKRSDEYAQVLQLRSLAAAFAVAMVSCVILGMLQIAGLALPQGLGLWLAFGAGMLTWAIAAAVAARR